MFYIWAVVMYVTISISCDVLHCFWQKWSIFCWGLDKAHAANFIGLLNANFASELLEDICGFVYVLLWNCAKTSPGEHQFEKVFGGGVCLICLLGCFCAERFSLKCREKSVQCLINRICKFVTSHNFSVERHICMVTPIFFSHRKYF